MDISPDDELIIGGDGESPETAVKFRPCHLHTHVAREQRFICERFGNEFVDWEEELHMTTLEGQSVWLISLGNGSQRSVYFDTSQTIYDNI